MRKLDSSGKCEQASEQATLPFPKAILHLDPTTLLHFTEALVPVACYLWLCCSDDSQRQALGSAHLDLRDRADLYPG